MEGSPIRYNKAHFDYPLGAYVIQVGLYTVALFERIELLFLRVAIFGAYTFSSEKGYPWLGNPRAKIQRYRQAERYFMVVSFM